MYGKYLVGRNQEAVETICTHAENLDENRLRDFLNQGHCVGVFHQEYNATMLLAKKGLHKATFLLIDTFKASLNHAACGAAEGGNLILLKTLLGRGASLHMAVKGAAIAKNDRLTEELLQEGASLNYAALGAGYSADQAFFEKYKTHKNFSRVIFLQGVQGAMKAGNTAFASALAKQCAAYLAKKPQGMVSGDVEDLELCGACGAAAGGFIKYAKAIIKSRDNGLDTRAEYLRNRVLEHAAFGGHVAFVEQLIKQEAHSDYAVLGAAAAGNKLLTMQLIARGASSLAAAEGAGAEGHLDLVNSLLEGTHNDLVKSELWLRALTGASKEGQLAILNLYPIAKENWYQTTLTIAAPLGQTNDSRLHFLSFINQAPFSNYIIEEFTPRTSTAILAKQAEKMNELIVQRSANFYQARSYLALTHLQRKYLFDLTPIMVKYNLSIGPYIYLLSFVLGLNETDTIKVYDLAHERVNKRLKDNPLSNFGLFSKITQTLQLIKDYVTTNEAKMS